MRSAVAIALVLLLLGCQAAERAVAERFVAIPRTAEEFAAIFKRVPKAADLSEILGVAERAEQRGLTLLAPLAASTEAAAFVSRIRATGAKVVTLQGHNEAGRFFFTDGSYVELSSLGEQIPNTIVAVISCDSARFVNGTAVGIPSLLTYRLAESTEGKFATRISRLLDDGSVVTADVAQAELERALRDATIELGLRNFFKISIATGGTVAGVGIYEQIDSR